MFSSSWRGARQSQGSHRRRSQRSYRPRVEHLELRLSPATRVWDGGSLVNSNWTTAANWVGDVAPTPGVDDLEFPGVAARKSNTNDFPVSSTFLGIAFTGTGYGLGGNGITLGGNLTSGASFINDLVNLPLTLNGDRTIHVEASSGLIIQGAIGESGGAWGITKTGTGILTLRGANTYSGTTTISLGRVNVEHPSALGSTAGGTIIAKGGALRLGNIPGPVVFPPEPLTFGAAGPVGLEAAFGNGTGDATWTGPVTFELGGNHIVADPGSPLRFTGPMSGPGGFRSIQGAPSSSSQAAPPTPTPA